MSRRSTYVAAGLIALAAAALPSVVLAAEPHAHGASMGLSLDHGQKWASDEALRTGMGKMHALVSAALEPIHSNAYAAKDYRALADRLQEQIDYVTANCKLPEAADAQLHVVLEKILDGIAGLKAGAGQQSAAIRVAEALDLYGAHFEHPGWTALAH